MSGFTPTTECPECKGKGKETFFNRKWMRKTWKTCKHCNGRGFLFDMSHVIKEVKK